jgi:hypothetical protein
MVMDGYSVKNEIAMQANIVADMTYNFGIRGRNTLHHLLVVRIVLFTVFVGNLTSKS